MPEPIAITQEMIEWVKKTANKSYVRFEASAGHYNNTPNSHGARQIRRTRIGALGDVAKYPL